MVLYTEDVYVKAISKSRHNLSNYNHGE